jgi:hypothetical protein
MATIDVKDRKFLLQKVVITGDPVPGQDGVQGPAGPAGSSVSSGITHDGTESNGNSVADILDGLLYEVLSILTFTNQHGTQERGAVLANVGLDWTKNKSSTVQEITGTSAHTPGVDDNSYTIVGANLSTTGTWQLASGDGIGPQDTASTTINFYDKIHWGARVVGTYDSAFILGLSGNNLQASRAKEFTVTAGASDYIYFACPTNYGTPIFWVKGVEGGFIKVASAITHTNSKGNSDETYDIWRSDLPNLGTTTVTVQ